MVIPKERVAKVRHVCADLVRAAGEQLDLTFGGSAVLAEHAVMGQDLLCAGARCVEHFHMRPGCVLYEPGLRRGFPGHRHAPHGAAVKFPDGAAADRVKQRGFRSSVAREEHEPRRGHIQPVHGAHIAVKGGEPLFQGVRAAVRPGDGHAARLVGNEYVRILIHHAHAARKPGKRIRKRRPCAALRQACEGHLLLAGGVLQRERIGPERDLLAGLCRGVIALIAPDGRIVSGELHTDLVMPAGEKVDVEQGEPVLLPGKPVGKGSGLCAGRAGGDEARVAGALIPQDAAFELFFRAGCAGNERTVTLRYAPVAGKRGGEARSGLRCAGEHQHAADGAVEPVHQAEVDLAGLRVFLFNICLCKGEQVNVPGGVRLHGDVHGLFHHKEVIVFIQNVHGRLCLQLQFGSLCAGGVPCSTPSP